MLYFSYFVKKILYLLILIFYVIIVLKVYKQTYQVIKEVIFMSIEGARIILERQQTDIEFKTQEDDEKDKQERAKILKEFGFGVLIENSKPFEKKDG